MSGIFRNCRPLPVDRTVHDWESIDKSGIRSFPCAGLFLSLPANSVALGKKKTIAKVAPDFLKREKESLIRRNRQVIYFNDKEMAAITEYCSRFKVNAKSSLFRQSIMEKVLKELDSNPPTLF